MQLVCLVFVSIVCFCCFFVLFLFWSYLYLFKYCFRCLNFLFVCYLHDLHIYIYMIYKFIFPFLWGLPINASYNKCLQDVHCLVQQGVVPFHRLVTFRLPGKTTARRLWHRNAQIWRQSIYIMAYARMTLHRRNENIVMQLWIFKIWTHVSLWRYNTIKISIMLYFKTLCDSRQSMWTQVWLWDSLWYRRCGLICDMIKRDKMIIYIIKWL